MTIPVTDVQQALRGFDYPGTGEQLAEHARTGGASDDVVDALGGIDHEVDGPTGVMEALEGQLTGTRG